MTIDTAASSRRTTLLDNLHLGTAPDSWGVWFPDDPQQVPWHQLSASSRGA